MELLVPPKREVLVYAPLSKKQEELYKMTVDKTINSWIVAKKVMMSFYPGIYDQHRENLKFFLKKRACSRKQEKFKVDICCFINSQGSHSDLKTWENGKVFFSQGKVGEF